MCLPRLPGASDLLKKMELLFREMQPGDRAGMEAFYRGLGEQSSAFFNVNRGNERRTMDFFGPTPRPNHRYFVAECGGEIAGHLFVWDTDTAVPWLGVAVRDDFQGKGVGTFLLTSLFGLLQKEGYGGLLLRTAQNNTAAQQLYEKCGFTRLGMHPSGEILYLKRFAKEEKA